jgi:phosphatidate cytidylyltransferase
MKRILTALVLIPAFVWLALFAPGWAFRVVLAAVGLIAFWEFDHIAEANGIARSGYAGMIAGLALMFAPRPEIVVVVVALLGMTLAMRVANLSGAIAAGATFTLGVVYIFGAFRCAIDLRVIDPNWLMFALLLSWAGDTAALYIGKAFGRRKLAPRVSPAKTWEGAMGSVGGGILAGWVYAHYLIPSAAVGMVIGIAAAGNIAGQIGDLCESAMKRGAGVKDSGNTLPGHGGWLDRIDSTLFSVPVVYAVVMLVQH